MEQLARQYNVIMICVVRARFRGMRVAVLSVLVYSRIQTTSGSTFPSPHSGSINATCIPTKQREMSFS